MSQSPRDVFIVEAVRTPIGRGRSSGALHTIHPVDRIVRQVVLRDLPLSTYGGIHWYPSHPPVEAIEFEMDLRGIGRETRMLL